MDRRGDERNNNRNSNRSRSRSPRGRRDFGRDDRDGRGEGRDGRGDAESRKRRRDDSAHGPRRDPRRDDFSRRGGDPLLNTLRDIRTGVNLANRLSQQLLLQMGCPPDQIPQAGKVRGQLPTEKNDEAPSDEKRRDDREDGEYDD